MGGSRVDELTDGYIRHLEDKNDKLTAELNDLTDGWNLQVDFIERQYCEEDFDFFAEYDVLLEELSEINPEFVDDQVRPEGPPKLRVISSDPKDA